MKQFLLVLTVVVLFVVTPASAKDKWTKIKSKHFTLIGNASERDIRTVGTKLEQFRSVFAQLFPRVRIDSPVPITVIVFKSKSAYVPFMPAYNGKISEVAGYFMPGQDINYISLTSEFGETNPYSTIFHEFVHSLTNDSTANLPLWLNEGIAEFYSMFAVSDKDTKVQLGAPISHHVFHLRDSKFLPLPQLFQVEHNSPNYNERDKKGVFYAQSWALVHYLMLGNNGQRQPQMGQFVNLMAAGMPMQEAFTKAFQTDFATLEKELRNYIGRTTYPVLSYTSKQKLVFDDEMTAEVMSEAEANFYLGDLLAHQRRTDADKYLQAAIQLDPTFAPPYASLGLTRIYTGNFEEAQKYLEKAVTYDKEGKNHLIYYYYAMALMREGANSNGQQIVYTELEKSKAQLVRANLQKAIQIRPSFSHAYSLLAFVNLTAGEQLDETIALLKRAMQDAPGNQDLTYQLAQIYLRQQKLEDAKTLLTPIARNATDASLKLRAQSTLESIQRFMDQKAKYQAEMEAFNKQQKATDDTEATAPERPALRRRNDSTTTEEPPVTLEPSLRPRTEGEEINGMLTKMECSEKGVTLHVTAGAQKLVFHTPQPQGIEFITYVVGVGEQIECKEFTPARYVRVIYRPHTDAKAKAKGEPISVEFLPEKK